jgi:hypothetical protein
MFRKFRHTFYSVYFVYTEFISSKLFHKNFSNYDETNNTHIFDLITYILASKRTFLTSKYTFLASKLSFLASKLSFHVSRNTKHRHFRYPKPVQNYGVTIGSKFLQKIQYFNPGIPNWCCHHTRVL